MLNNQYILGRLFCPKCSHYQTELHNVNIQIFNESPFVRYFAKCPNCNEYVEFKHRPNYEREKNIREYTDKEAIRVLNDILKFVVVITILALLMIMYSVGFRGF